MRTIQEKEDLRLRSVTESDYQLLKELLTYQHPTTMLEYHRMCYDALVEDSGTNSNHHAVYRDLERFYEGMNFINQQNV